MSPQCGPWLIPAELAVINTLRSGAGSSASFSLFITATAPPSKLKQETEQEWIGKSAPVQRAGLGQGLVLLLFR